MSQFFERLGTDLPTVFHGMPGHFPPPDVLRAMQGFNAQKYALADETYWGAPATADSLDPAFYTVRFCHQRGVLLVKTKTVSDDPSWLRADCWRSAGFCCGDRRGRAKRRR